MNRTKPIAMATSYFRSRLASSANNVTGSVQTEGRKSLNYTTEALVKAASGNGSQARTMESVRPPSLSQTSSEEKSTWKLSSERWKSDGLFNVAGDCHLTGF